jgi:hypothetical protein
MSGGDPNDDAIRDLGVFEHEPQHEGGVPDLAHPCGHGISPDIDNMAGSIGPRA